jgi:hypothetical protein
MKKNILTNPLFFLGFLFLFLATLDAIFLHSLKEDVIETFFMGMEFTISYPKHPFVSFWVSGAILKIIPQQLIPIIAPLLKYALFFAITFYTMVFSKKIFQKNEEILSILATYGVAVALMLKNLDFTPDIFFTTFAAFFIGSTYNLIQKPSTLNYISTCILGWLLFFTKYHAVIVFFGASLPFILTKEGRNTAFSLKSSLFAPIFLAPIACYITYAHQHNFPSIAYASEPVSANFFKQIGNIVHPLNTFPILILLLIPQVRSSVKSSISKSILSLKTQNFNIIFLLSNSIVFFIAFLILSYTFNHHASIRYFLSNVIFFQCFTLYLFKNAFLQATHSRLAKNIIISSLVICSTIIILDNPHKNNIALSKTNKELTQYIEEKTQGNFEVMVEFNRKFDKTYPYFTKKLYIYDENTNSREIMRKTLADKNFIMVWEPDWKYSLPYNTLKKYKWEFPNHKITLHAPFYKKVEAKLPLQKSYEVNAQFFIFELEKNKT